MTVHDFSSQLSFSHGAAGEPEWCAAYRQAWPDLAEIIDMRHPGEHQKQGIDRVVVLPSGKIMTIDEKVRREQWPDLLVEIWSVYEDRVPGWTVAPWKKCSHIAYLFLPRRTCILVPFDELRRATIANQPEWQEAADAERDGFRWVKAENRRPNHTRYTTWSIAVPNKVIQRAILAAMVITWPAAERAPGP